MRIKHWSLAALAILFTAGIVRAQDRDTSERNPARVRSGAIAQVVRGMYAASSDADDAVLGVFTTSSGERDTLGLLVTGVVAGGPADKAGIEEGNRIASVNGVNLKLASEDAGEPDMQGMTTRRLVRELGKVKAGDQVELSLWKQGQYTTVQIKTTAREDLPGNERVTIEKISERPVIGLTLQSTGSVRDSIGPMVIAVESGGPAESAGIVEGDRITSVNGKSLAVSADDAKEGFVSSARVTRFSRMLNDMKVGDELEIGVYSGGTTKTLHVKTASSKDVYGEQGGVMFFRGGDGVGIAPMAPIPPMAPAIVAPRVRVVPRVMSDGDVHDLTARAMDVRATKMAAERALVMQQARATRERVQRTADLLQTQQRQQSEQAQRMRELDIVRTQQRLQSEQARRMLELRQERSNQEMQRVMEQLRNSMQKTPRRTTVVM
jgi:S1-C subfamily serine protease